MRGDKVYVYVYTVYKGTIHFLRMWFASKIGNHDIQKLDLIPGKALFLLLRKACLPRK